MAYDPTVPQQANQVRSLSGDLTKMRENFATLDPVAVSGLHGLISGGSVASGVIARTVSGTAAGQWHYIPHELDSVNDVNAPSPTDGQALVWDQATSAWIPGAAAGGGSGGGAGGLVFDGVERSCILRLPSGDTQTISNGVAETVTGMELVRNVGSFAFTSSGIELPSGVTHYRVLGQIRYATDGTGTRRVQIRKAPDVDILQGANPIFNAAASQPTTIQGLNPLQVISGHGVTGASGAAAGQSNVAPGDTIVLRARADGAAPNVEWGGGGQHQTFLEVQAFKLAEAETAAVSGDTLKAHALIYLASGVTQAITASTLTQVTGMTLLRAAGTVSVNVASGVIEAPSGVTFAEASAQVKWTSNNNGSRQVSIGVSGTDVLPGGMRSLTVGNTNFAAAQPTGQQVSCPFIAVSGGEEISIQVTHSSTTDPLDLLAGNNPDVWLEVRFYE